VVNYLKGRIKSLGHALNGLRLLFGCGPNMRIMLTAVVLVTAAGLYFEVTEIEWALIILCCALVLGIEILNTAIERLADRLHRERDPEIGRIKDLGAAASLVASIAAALVGVLIFGKIIMGHLFGGW